jgi:hypothetical protein
VGKSRARDPIQNPTQNPTSNRPEPGRTAQRLRTAPCPQALRSARGAWHGCEMRWGTSVRCAHRPSQLVYPPAVLGRKGTRNPSPLSALSRMRKTRRGYSVNCTPARLTTVLVLIKVKIKKKKPTQLSTLNHSHAVVAPHVTPHRGSSTHHTPLHQSPPTTRGAMAHEEQNDPVAQSSTSPGAWGSLYNSRLSPVALYPLFWR